MNSIKEQILIISKDLKIDVKRLDSFTSREILGSLIKKYTNLKNYSFPLWHFISNKESIYYLNGWSLIDKFERGSKGIVYLFFEPSDEKEVLIFPSMSSVKAILEEVPGFVFYLSNSDLEFLICFNDHDYLIGSGTGKSWIEELGK